jgi:hypothetical protein
MHAAQRFGLLHVHQHRHLHSGHKSLNNRVKIQESERYSKINEENRTTKKHKWKLAKGNHVQVEPAKQIPSGI